VDRVTGPTRAWRPGSVLGCIAFLLVVVGLGCIGRCLYLTREAPAVPAAERPADWAQPVELPGLPNLDRVTAGLYRGAQPSAEGFAELNKLGIRTDVNLRSGHDEKQQAEAAGLRYVSIPMHAWHAEDEDIAAFLKAVTDPENGPYFVHCQHGSDRTGVCIAAYRVAVQGWPKEEAVREMTGGDYGFHSIWENLADYIQNMDVAGMRRRAGLDEAAP
jgi:protein tyrosine phosphatase (PTP) superfamily phosphohydrolase (DUF442 family)